MNPSQNANALNSIRGSQEYIKAKNVEIKKHNRNVHMRNFLRSKKH